MYVVVAYDIPVDARRTRIARLLEGYGQRVQYSVFECDLEEKHLHRMMEGLEKLMAPGDGVRVYRMAKGRPPDLTILGGMPCITFRRTTIV